MRACCTRWWQRRMATHFWYCLRCKLPVLLKFVFNLSFSRDTLTKVCFRFDFIPCISVPPAYMCVHHMCSWCLWRSEEGITAPGTGVMDGCNYLGDAGNWTSVLCENKCSWLSSHLSNPKPLCFKKYNPSNKEKTTTILLIIINWGNKMTTRELVK